MYKEMDRTRKLYNFINYVRLFSPIKKKKQITHT